MMLKILGVMLFAAGFAAGALLFLNKADAPLALAQMQVQEADSGFNCIFFSPTYLGSDGVSGDELPNRFGVYYEMPTCLSTAGYQAVRAWFFDRQHFAIRYEKYTY